MKSAPLVSIITPFFNAERYLSEAIESVLAQSRDDWELLLVDDGSVDRGTEIAKSYAATHPDRIRVLEHEGHQNRGRSTSRNLGIRQARGKYLAFLDADDVYLPEKLARQIHLIESQPDAVMVYGRTEYWYSWTGKWKDRWRDRVARLGVPPGSLIGPPRLLTLFLRRGGVVPCTCGIVVRKETALAVGAFDESFQSLHEDLVFVAKICLNSSVYVEDGCWARYRQHEESSCRQAIRNGRYHPIRLNPARLLYLQWLARSLAEQKVQDHDLWRMLNRELWLYRHPLIAGIGSSVSYAARAGSVVLGILRYPFSQRTARGDKEAPATPRRF